jgi:hypothetical protein
MSRADATDEHRPVRAIFALSEQLGSHVLPIARQPPGAGGTRRRGNLLVQDDSPAATDYQAERGGSRLVWVQGYQHIWTRVGTGAAGGNGRQGRYGRPQLLTSCADRNSDGYAEQRDGTRQ